MYRFDTLQRMARHRGYELEREQHATHEYVLWSNERAPGIQILCKNLAEVMSELQSITPLFQLSNHA